MECNLTGRGMGHTRTPGALGAAALRLKSPAGVPRFPPENVLLGGHAGRVHVFMDNQKIVD